MDVGIGGDGRAHVDADGRGVDQFDLRDAVRVHGAHVFGQFLSMDGGFQPGNKALQDQRRFAGTGHAGDRRQASLGEIDLQRPDRVDGPGR